MKTADTFWTKIVLLVENHWQATEDVRLLRTLGRHVREEHQREDRMPGDLHLVRKVRGYQPQHVRHVELTTRYSQQPDTDGWLSLGRTRSALRSYLSKTFSKFR